MRPGTHSLVVVASIFGGIGLAACGPAMGSEGGPCTSGGGCDPGLVCTENVCVTDEDACVGDEPATHSRADCSNLGAAACPDLNENIAVVACEDAAAVLRSGAFQAAYMCLRDIPITRCGSLDAAVTDCFAALTACPLPAAESVCSQAADTCAQEGDTEFPTSTCVSDLTPTNQAFRDAWAACFNGAVTVPCRDVHDNCYNVAVNALVGEAP